MNFNRNLFSLLLIAFVVFSTSTKAQEFSGAEAQKIVNGSEKVVLDPNYDFPTFVKFSSGSEIDFLGWEKWMRKSFKFSSGVDFVLLKTESDDLGFTHYRYSEVFQSMPVLGADLILHVKDGKVVSLNGKVRNKIELDETTSFTENDALQKALLFTNATRYKWQMPEEELQIKRVKNDINASYYPKGILVVVPEKGNFKSQTFKIAYKFDIYADQPMSRKYVFVDANNGGVLFTLDRIHFDNKDVNVNTSASAATKYSGTRTITTDSYNGSYRLRETGRGLGIETYNLQQGTNTGAAVDFTNATTTWTGTNTAKDEVARDAHWGAEMTWDYYSIKHGRNSVDNAGMKLISYVHYDVNYVNAYWDGTSMTYGDGNGTTYSPLTTLDICAHEITHGVTENSANLVYQDESGAMNEGFSDIFGVAIEWYAKPPLTTGNWTMGEEIGAPFRSMSNPNAYGDPDTYMGTNWAPLGGADNGGVHTNSGVLNYWFYLLAQGGTGTNDIGNAFTVTTITMDKAEKIAYRTLANYLTTSSTFADARTASIQACMDLYGGCGFEAQQVTNAWYAVGVGAAYTAAPTSADFTTGCIASQCTAPFTVQFNNTSVNANSFTWYFGDGTTSTLSNPSHTYTANGSYNVKLVSLGGTCGSDSITKNAFITVGPAYPCAASIPATGVGVTQTSCNGTLTDSGICGDYVDNTDGSITISPVGATNVTLTFTSFNYEATYDFLYVYDGPTTASPQVTGSPFSGTSIPGPIVSTGGSVTLRQTTDVGVTASGFALTWACEVSTNPPVANFNVSATSTCIGIVNFTDVSTNGPTSWLWDFGDGQTSTLQNPSHTYITNGTFTVTLTSTNAYGSDAEVKTSYILINMPTAPVTTGANRCGAGTLNLSATGSGNLNWYDAPTGGTIVNTGNAYTTPVLNTTTDYFVQDSILGSSVNVGKLTNSGTGGYTATGDRYLIFDCYTPLTLVSVQVYSNSTTAMAKTIELRSSTGTVLQTKNVTIPNGQSTVSLNFPLPVGTALRLAVTNVANLFRNDGGITYPYTTPGYISVTNSDAGATRYYAFYNWVVAEPACLSPRSIVTATINNVPVSVISTSSPTAYCVGFPISSVLNANTNAGLSYQWLLNGSNISGAIGSSYTATALGNYSVIETNSCGNNTSNTITISTNGIAPVATITPAGSTTICSGNSVVLNGNIVSGNSYQWQLNGANIAGATNNSYTATAAGTYTLVVTNGCGNITSSPTTVIVNSLPTTPVVSQVLGVLYSSSPTGNQWYSTPPPNPIPGATNQSYTPSVSGLYYVVVTDGNSCSSLNSNEENFIFTNISKNELFDFNLMPNPNNGEFIITFGNASETNLKLNILNSIGEIVFSKNLSTELMQNISISNLSSGIYFVKIHNEKINIIKKVIVQK